MSKKDDREGLSLAYRIGWRLRYAGWHAFGPAELVGNQDPHVRLRRERQAKVDAAKAARSARQRPSA